VRLFAHLVEVDRGGDEVSPHQIHDPFIRERPRPERTGVTSASFQGGVTARPDHDRPLFLRRKSTRCREIDDPRDLLPLDLGSSRPDRGGPTVETFELGRRRLGLKEAEEAQSRRRKAESPHDFFPGVSRSPTNRIS
jgi:hypothetical protein